MVLVLANQVQLTRSQSKDQVNLLSDSFKKKKKMHLTKETQDK